MKLTSVRLRALKHAVIFYTTQPSSSINSGVQFITVITCHVRWYLDSKCIENEPSRSLYDHPQKCWLMLKAFFPIINLCFLTAQCMTKALELTKTKLFTTQGERSWGTLKCYLQHFETFHCANFLKLKAWSMSCSLKFDLTASNEEAVWQARYALSQSAGRGTLHRNKSWSWRLYGKHWLIGLSGARNAVRATRWTVWRECCLKQHACITFLSWTIPCEGNIYPGFSHISNL